jgi:peptidoglycan/LPS O-acetylase OafA/YrhL
MNMGRLGYYITIMGLLRFLLALSVVIDHTGPIFGYHLLSGKMAVQTFFILSGFYMALILNEKYTHRKNSFWLYISNRFLRIYPLYWLVLICTCIFLLSQNTFNSTFTQIPVSELIIKNLTIFVTTDYWWKSAAYSGLYVFQAWTLGLELIFYLLAPLLVFRGGKSIFGLFLGSLILRFVITHFVIFYPFEFMDRFFITEICFFLLGVLAYKIYAKPLFPLTQIYKKYGQLLVGLVIGATLLFQFIPSGDIFADNKFLWLYFLLIGSCVPAIFSVTKKVVWDRAIGELSYPIYIAHALLIDVAKAVWPQQWHSSWFSLAILIAVCFLAISLNEFLLKPIEKIRKKRTQKIGH